MKRIYLNNLEEEVFLDDDGLEVLFFPDRLDDLVDPLVGVFLVQRGQQRFQVSGRVQTEPESAHLEREAQPGLQRRRHLWIVFFFVRPHRTPGKLLLRFLFRWDFRSFSVELSADDVCCRASTPFTRPVRTRLTRLEKTSKEG